MEIFLYKTQRNPRTIYGALQFGSKFPQQTAASKGIFLVSDAHINKQNGIDCRSLFSSKSVDKLEEICNREKEASNPSQQGICLEEVTKY